MLLGRLLAITLLAPTLVAGLQVSEPPGETRSLLDPTLLKSPVQNTLELTESEGGFSLSGETDTTAGYQLMTVDLPLRPDTIAVQLRTAGTIAKGGIYVALLDGSGQFLQPMQTYRVGAVPNTLHTIPTLGNSSVKLVLGNAESGTKSSWNLTRIELTELDFDPTGDLVFRAAYLGSLPPGFLKPVANTLQLSRRDGKILLTGTTGSTQRYQIMSVPLTVGEDTQLIRVMLEGQVVQGQVYYALLDDQGRFIGLPQTAGAGPIRSDSLFSPGSTKSFSFVLGNDAGGRPSEVAISQIEIDRIGEENRQKVLYEYAVSRRFQGSAWRWAWDVLFGIRPAVRP